MRKIAIPTDFSTHAMNALRYASELFKYEKCEFFILHAYAENVYHKSTFYATSFFEEIKSTVANETAEHLKYAEAAIKDFSPNPHHSYKTLAKFGLLIDEINDLVDSENIDVVVMATKGKNNDSRLTFGSNALQVLKYVKAPVITIPVGYKYTQPRDILFATDFMMPFQRREIKLLGMMCKSYRGIINMLYLSSTESLSMRQQTNKEFLEDCLAENKLNFHRKPSDDLFKSITEFIGKNEIDLLVMINSRNSYIESILYSSQIDKIELKVKIPFLVMQNLKR
ncbi:MAG: universal stress protein [Leeuwenhoekiella sp.]